MVDRYKVVVGNVTATAHGAAHPEGEYVLWRDYEALRAEAEAHKRSRQIDANEARSLEMELRAEVERLTMHKEQVQHAWLAALDQVDIPKDVRARIIITAAAELLMTAAVTGDGIRDADPTPASPASTTDA